MVNKCKTCQKIFDKEAITHVAGFPEREHIFCSEQCLAHFLRMEDDELEYADFLLREKEKRKQHRG